jgi:hypothetical protein
MTTVADTSSNANPTHGSETANTLGAVHIPFTSMTHGCGGFLNADGDCDYCLREAAAARAARAARRGKTPRKQAEGEPRARAARKPIPPGGVGWLPSRAPQLRITPGRPE